MLQGLRCEWGAGVAGMCEPQTASESDYWTPLGWTSSSVSMRAPPLPLAPFSRTWPHLPPHVRLPPRGLGRGRCCGHFLPSLGWVGRRRWSRHDMAHGLGVLLRFRKPFDDWLYGIAKEAGGSDRCVQKHLAVWVLKELIPVGFRTVHLRKHGLCRWVDVRRLGRRPRLNELIVDVWKKQHRSSRVYLTAAGPPLGGLRVLCCQSDPAPIQPIPPSLRRRTWSPPRPPGRRKQSPRQTEGDRNNHRRR